MSLATRLRQFPSFSGLEAVEIEGLAAAGDVLDLPAGHVLIEEGTQPDGFFIVLEGEIEVAREIEGRRTVLAHHGPGDLMGIVSLLDHGARSATCTAVGPVKVAWLPEAAFELLHRGNPRLALHFQALVARQLARDTRALNAALVRAMIEGAASDQDPLSGEFHVSVRG